MAPTQEIVSGLLNIDKPKGLTSHDVVKRVRKLSGQRKVGHTGTLDPMATGVLLVCLGQATRLIEYLTGGLKQYLATIRFGLTTDTLDADGQVVGRSDASNLTEQYLRELLPIFEGEIKQVPPVFSALKKNGQPLYKLARAGRPVTVEPRPVTIYGLKWRDWRPPDLTLEISCSAGTYIRALARDMGDAVETGATLIGLTRTINAHWKLDQAVSLETMEQASHDDGRDWHRYLYPIEQMLPHLPKVVLDEVAARRVVHGEQVQLELARQKPGETRAADSNVLQAYTESGQFLAILILKQGDSGEDIWQPKKVFQTELSQP